MNRSLVIPAGCCLCAFVALLAVLQMGTGREAAADPVRAADISTRSYRATAAPVVNQALLSEAEARQMLTTMSGE